MAKILEPEEALKLTDSERAEEVTGTIPLKQTTNTSRVTQNLLDR